MMKFTTLPILVILACVFVQAKSATPYTDCGSTTGQLTSLELVGCDGVDRCSLKRNSAATLKIGFKSKVDSTSATAVVKGVIGGIPLPFNFPQPNACEKSGLACPLKSNTDYLYTTTLPIKASYPPLKVDIKFTVEDQNSENIFCALIPAVLV